MTKTTREKEVLEEGSRKERTRGRGKGQSPGAVLEERRVNISEERDVKAAVYAVLGMASRAGFPQTARFMIATAASELCTNMFVYAGKGTLRARLLLDVKRLGIEITALDHGPGIEDVGQAMKDHFSTGKSLGLGLPGVKRMMDDFAIRSIPGKGTRVTARKWISAPASPETKEAG